MPSGGQPTPYPADPKSAVADVLAHRVRVLSLAQIARTWFSEAADPRGGARRLAQALQRRGSVESVKLMARPEIMPDRPLVTWQPGLPQPDLGPVAWTLRKRRRDQAPVATPCLLAATGRHPRPTDTTHDLHLAAVFLLMCKEMPTRACSWVFEDDLIRPGQKLPDALVTDGRAKTAIECGGEYDRQRLQEDHNYFARKGYGYEIW